MGILSRNDYSEQLEQATEAAALEAGSARATQGHRYADLVEDPIGFALKLIQPDSTNLGGGKMAHLNKDVVLSNLTAHDIILHREYLDLARECDDFGFKHVSFVLREAFVENILQSMAKGGLTTRLLHSNNSNISLTSKRDNVKKGLFGK